MSDGSRKSVGPGPKSIKSVKNNNNNRNSLPSNFSFPSSSKSCQNPNPNSSVRNKCDVLLSQAKVRAIMKSSPEVENVPTDSLFILTKATELFIDYMARKTVENPRGISNYDYKNLAEVVQRDSNLDFLKEIIPLKVSARAALQEIAKQKAQQEKLEVS